MLQTRTSIVASLAFFIAARLFTPVTHTAQLTLIDGGRCHTAIFVAPE